MIPIMISAPSLRQHWTVTHWRVAVVYVDKDIMKRNMTAGLLPPCGCPRRLPQSSCGGAARENTLYARSGGTVMVQ